jgi:hypothetical protein
MAAAVCTPIDAGSAAPTRGGGVKGVAPRSRPIHPNGGTVVNG